MREKNNYVFQRIKNKKYIWLNAQVPIIILSFNTNVLNHQVINHYLVCCAKKKIT